MSAEIIGDFDVERAIGIGEALELDAELLAHDAARTLPAHQIAASDRLVLAGCVDDMGNHTVGALLERGELGCKAHVDIRVRLRHLGRLQDLSLDIQKAVRDSVELTRNNTRIGLNVCFNYGGRAELVDAIRQIIADGRNPDTITEELISSYLYTRDLPDPDMVIRTAGEMRVSNFLLWQSAYSEYYATPTLWPDFGREDLRQALDSYHRRQRRFGRIAVPPTTVAQGE